MTGYRSICTVGVESVSQFRPTSLVAGTDVTHAGRCTNHCGDYHAALGAGMKVARRYCWTLLGLLGITPTHGRDLNPTELFRAAAPSVVVIEALDADGRTRLQGSGVVVAAGQVVTNCHVVDQARVLVIREGTGDRYGELRYRDPERDLCQLSVSLLDAVPAKTRPVGSLQIGETVYAIGAPRGLELTLSNGIVSSLRPLQGAMLVQTTAAISPGSSGGGLFDAQGNLVGITTLYLTDSQALNFAVPTDWIWELPSRSSVAAEADLAKREDWDRRVKSARERLNALEKWLAETYSNYRELRPQFIERAKAAIAEKPPEQWPETVLNTYLQLTQEVDAATSNGQGRWRLVYEDEDSQIFVDSNSMSRTRHLVSAWHEAIYRKQKTLGQVKGVKRSLSKAVWNCADRTYKLVSTVFYDENAAVLGGADESPNIQFTSVVPGSLGEIKWESVCQ